MYVNQIDELFGSSIDNMYYSTISKTTKVTRDIVKYKEDLKKLIDSVTIEENVDMKSLKKYIKNENLPEIMKIIEKYIFLYLFTSICVSSQKDIDYLKSEFLIKEKKLNSELVADIIKLVQMANAIISVLTKSKKSTYKTEGTEFIKLFSEDILDKLKSKDSNVVQHNVVKTIILFHYARVDRKYVMKLLESKLEDTSEYIYIDIVVPKKRQLDLFDVESTLTQEEIENNEGKKILETINVAKVQQQQLTPDEKISKLFSSKIIVPIVEDFLLYHVDNEHYETVDKEDSDTVRIKFFLDKIDNFSKLYSGIADKKTKELIYAPMSHRLAISDNVIDNAKILNQSIRAFKQSEYYDSFVKYESFPYINFSDFQNSGFSYISDDSFDVIRHISFDDKSRNILQVHSNSNMSNISGIAVPTTHNSLECVRVNNTKELKDIGQFVEYLSKNLFEKRNKLQYVLFKTTESIINNPADYWMKQLEMIHDELLHVISKQIYNKISNVQLIQNAFQTAIKVMNKTLQIPDNVDVYYELVDKIYRKFAITNIEKHDNEEDIFHGLAEKSHSVPEYSDGDLYREHAIHILTHEPFERAILDEATFGICQHYVTWEKVIESKRKSVLKYTQSIDEFMQKYADLTEEDEFICKSCGAMLNVKKYITEGEYDKASGKFITFGTQIVIPLEDMNEYAKYKKTIKAVDSLIDKITSLNNIPLFSSGSKKAAVSKRREMVKNVIDVIALNNSLIEKISKKIGISSFFNFQLNDSIFVYSSDEKDYYKFIKNNNVIAYIIFMILLELNESQITYMLTDKYCNFNAYLKFGGKIFDELKIITLKNGRFDNITNYPVLCLFLYIMSCVISKYSIWFSIEDKQKTDPKKKVVRPFAQLSIIHTVVDVLNSVVENANKNQNKKIFEVISLKYYKKLESTYSNRELIETLKGTKKTEVIDESKEEKLVKIPLLDVYVPVELEPYKLWIPRISKKYNVPKDVDYTNEIVVSNLFYCPDGQVHKFVNERGNFKCVLCGASGSNDVYDEKLTKGIRKNLKNIAWDKIGRKYCLTGRLHEFLVNLADGTKTCILCGYVLNSKISQDKLLELEKNVPDYEKIYTNELIEIANIDELLKIISTKENKLKYLKDTMKHTLGDTFNIAKKKYNLVEDTYIIEYDHLGNPLTENIILNKEDYEIIKNHEFFNTSVYEVVHKKTIKSYYDTKSLVLLGYSIRPDTYVNHLVQSAKLIKSNSVMSNLEQLGCSLSGNKLRNLKSIVQRLIIAINLINNGLTYRNIDETNEFDSLCLRYHGTIKINSAGLFQDWQNYTYKLSGDTEEELFKYLIDELVKLIEKNDEVKNEIMQFLVEYIELCAQEFNMCDVDTNYEIQKFMSDVEVSDFAANMGLTKIFIQIGDEKVQISKDPEHDIYSGEYFDPFETKSKEEIEEAIDLKEESEAIDMDGKLDREHFYEVSYVDRVFE